MDNISIGERVRNRRIELGLKQEELAGMLGYSSRFSIVKIESGQNTIPVQKLDDFAEVLHTTVSFLLGKESEDKCYYLNSETKQIAKLAYERRSIRELFNIIKNLSDEDIEACTEFLKKINKIK